MKSIEDYRGIMKKIPSKRTVQMENLYEKLSHADSLDTMRPLYRKLFHEMEIGKTLFVAHTKYDKFPTPDTLSFIDKWFYGEAIMKFGSNNVDIMAATIDPEKVNVQVPELSCSIDMEYEKSDISLLDEKAFNTKFSWDYGTTEHRVEVDPDWDRICLTGRIHEKWPTRSLGLVYTEGLPEREHFAIVIRINKDTYDSDFFDESPQQETTENLESEYPQQGNSVASKIYTTVKEAKGIKAKIGVFFQHMRNLRTFLYWVHLNRDCF